jgi:hypothetical protein
MGGIDLGTVTLRLAVRPLPHLPAINMTWPTEWKETVKEQIRWTKRVEVPLVALKDWVPPVGRLQWNFGPAQIVMSYLGNALSVLVFVLIIVLCVYVRYWRKPGKFPFGGPPDAPGDDAAILTGNREPFSVNVTNNRLVLSGVEPENNETRESPNPGTGSGTPVAARLLRSGLMRVGLASAPRRELQQWTPTTEEDPTREGTLA